MKLDQLLKREAFHDIFEKTLRSYLVAKEDWNGEFHWDSKMKKGSMNLIINKNINLFFPIRSSRKDIEFLAKEYTYHVKPWRRVLQAIYVYLSLTKCFRNLFASQRLSIEPSPKSLSNICIIPGNHSIRIIDLDFQRCLVLAKSVYGIKKLKNTVSLRTSFPNLPGPKIITWDKTGKWYVEERIFAVPIDRLSNSKNILKPLAAARLFLNELYRSTHEFSLVSKWFEKKFKQLEVAINYLPNCYSSNDIDTFKDLNILLKGSYKNLTYGGQHIDISQTHGDFQAANILFPETPDEHGVYLIDWEYSGIRCMHYDAFVYYLNARSPINLSDRINRLCNNDEKMKTILTFCNLELNKKNTSNLFIFSFLIDEFLFRLDDGNLPNLLEPSKGLLIFTEEVKKITFLHREGIYNEMYLESR